MAASGVLSTKALKDAAIGSMVDYTLQVGLNWAFFAKDDATIEEIAKDVDFYQIAASGAENAFSSSISNQRTQVLLGAGISCMFDGSFEDGNLRKDFNLEECAKGIASAVIANQISNFALAKLQNLDTERLKRGLLRLGIPQKEWTRFLRWLGIKNADHIAEGVEKSLEELLSGLKKVVPSDQWDKFVDDFGKDAAKLAKFDANPKLVDSWKALGEFPNLRKIPANLETLNKVKGKFTYNGKVGQEALEEIFTGHRSVQNFIDNFKKYDEIIGSIDDITVTGIKSSSEVRILNKGSQAGKIVDGKLNVNYSGFGGDIVCDPNKTTTLLGKWKDPAGGGTGDIINSKLSKSGENLGGPNVLSEDIPKGWTDQQIWDNVNEPWLRNAANRGDVIRVVSDPTKTTNLYKQGTELSFFGREHELLTKPVSQGGLGYTYNPSTFTYTK